MAGCIPRRFIYNVQHSQAQLNQRLVALSILTYSVDYDDNDNNMIM